MEWQIFFIGPMGATDPKDDDKLRNHLQKLHRFLINYIRGKHGYSDVGPTLIALTKGTRIDAVTLKKDGDVSDTIHLLTPFDLYGAGNIPDEVFDAIDDSDLIIADLSGNKPAVIYELAFAHALGIETILVGDPVVDKSFYFSLTRMVKINFDDEEINSDGLKKAIDVWFASRDKKFKAQNPLTNFYGAPLPDISAAYGLATGFFNNFARPILVSSQFVRKIEDDEKLSDLKGLIVVRPSNLSQRIDQIEKKLEMELLSHFPAQEIERGKRGELFMRISPTEIRVPFFLVRGYLIDIPRAMFSLALSKRLLGKKTDKLRKNMEGVLIGSFFEGVKELLVKEQSVKEEMFHYCSIEEIPDIIETGQSNTWA